MSTPEEAFDPYFKWLGIRPKDQPPNHYRLLGVETFEWDPDVISNAADARMIHIKTFQSGKYAAASQRILNELASAKVCLLNPQKKAEYDAGLRNKLQAEGAALSAVGATVVEPHAGGPPPLPSSSSAAEAEMLGLPLVMSPHRRRKTKAPWKFWTAVAVAATLLAALVGVLMTGHGRSPVAQQPGPSAVQPDKAEPLLPGSDRQPQPQSGGPSRAAEVSPLTRPHGLQSGQPAPEELQHPTVKASPPTTKEPSPPTKEPSVTTTATREPSPPVTPPQSSLPAATTPNPQEPVQPQSGPPELPNATPHGPGKDSLQKTPVPDEAARQAVEKSIKAIYEKELQNVKNPAQKQALAERLLQEGRATTDDTMARFVLYQLAYDLAGAGGEIPTALDVVDEIAKSYEINAVEMKSRTLTKALETARSTAGVIAASQEVAQTAMLLIDEATDADDFETAGRLARLAVSAAKRSKSPEFMRVAAERSRETERLRERFKNAEDSRAALAENPDDAKANLAAGRWQCFARNQWDEGLRCLAKGSNPALAALAREDLARPAQPDRQFALAEKWWKQADGEEAILQPQLRARAGYWYNEALQRLSGQPKATAQRRLQEIARQALLRHPRQPGIVQSDNVALAGAGTSAVGPEGPLHSLIDGNTSAKNAAASANCPCEWTIIFSKVYSLREIRLLLSDREGNKFYRYVIAISPDGQTFTPLVDRSQGQWFGWQYLRFAARPVKAIKLYGLYGSGSGRFSAVELEAYCIPPERAMANNTLAHQPIEAEKLRIVDRNGCNPSAQPMKVFGAGSWSEDTQLFGGGQVGASVTLALPVTKPGRYRLGLYFTQGPDYGTVQALLDGKLIGQPFDGYAPAVIPAGLISCGRVELTAGAHTLTLQVTGKNPLSSGYLFGLDCIELR